MWDNFPKQLYDNIILNDRWQLYLEGLGNTLLLTLGGLVLGIVIGSLLAVLKVFAGYEHKTLVGRIVFKVLDIIADIYITIIRGIPMMVLILLVVFVIFAAVPMDYRIMVAIFALGVNSGAYVAEIMRAGITAVDIGQTEAGRSLGLTSNMTMWSIVFPQAIKNILPALGNELIVLFKETAIVGYAAISDLTMQAMFIRSRTYSIVPLLVIAVVYLIFVLIMTFVLKKFERRLHRSDSR